ncbi:DUF6479 family protein [Streptomyces sp. NPDC047108]|uniref:DUF6479 family protein n=1 Tax=Streptomyces sp. NPDC047108 TaxID=3155025 RepID=UPI0033F8EB5E
MLIHASQVLAASGTGALWLIVVGAVIGAVLVGAFLLGSRKARHRRRSTPTPGTTARRGRQDQRGESWQTPDDM